MKILYVHQFFNTPQEGGNIRSYYLAHELVKRGHQVHVITSHVGRHRSQKDINGIQVTYIPIDYENQFGFWKRINAYSVFAWKASRESIKVRNVDLCYIMTTPLTTGFIGLFNKFLLGRKYIFEVGDLWPWVPIEMGVFKNPIVKATLYWCEKIFYHQSVGCVGLSPPISDYIMTKAPNVPLETVYNMSDCDYFTPQVAGARLKKKYGISDEMVITYTGTFGMANDLARMVKIMKGVEYLPLKFLFIGMGAEKEVFEQQVAQEKLSNCLVIDFQPKEAMKEVLAVSDAMLIAFANYPSLFTGSPNKLFDALAAGLLVITNFDGWIKELIESKGCGFAFQHDSVNDFETKIKTYLKNPQLLKVAKHESRKLAEDRFALKIQSERQVKFLEQAVDSYPLS